jgi:hypothetical protein
LRARVGRFAPSCPTPPSPKPSTVCAKNGALIVSEDGARIAGIISDRGIMNAIADHGVDVVNERSTV